MFSLAPFMSRHLPGEDPLRLAGLGRLRSDLGAEAEGPGGPDRLRNGLGTGLDCAVLEGNRITHSRFGRHGSHDGIARWDRTMGCSKKIDFDSTKA